MALRDIEHDVKDPIDSVNPSDGDMAVEGISVDWSVAEENKARRKFVEELSVSASKHYLCA
ncbi:hypothetical protein AUP68_06950 [Ilyonectria robusta]